MKITEDTKAMAQAVYDYLIMNPDKHEQAQWIGRDDQHLRRVTKALFEHCGTTMCIAGTAVYLSEGIEGLDKRARSSHWYDDKTLSSLGFEDSGEAQMLFGNMDNSEALDMLNALAQGDEEKFNNIYEAGWG